MADEYNLTNDYEGMIVTDDALAVIACVAAMEVPGVYGMSGGFTGGLAEVLGGRNSSKGVKVISKDGVTTVDIYVILKYGVRIPEVAFNIQEHVKNTIENQTAVLVDSVNIHVQGVNFDNEEGNAD